MLIADKLTHFLIQEKIIDEANKEVYQFGIRQLLLFLINIGSTVLLGIAVGMVWESVLFTASYVPLRKFAGGYHAKTPMICFIMSTLLICIALVIIRYIELRIEFAPLIVIIACAIVFIKAPVESRNKPLSSNEEIAFRRRTRIILLFEVLLITVLFLMSWYEACKCVIVSIVMVALLTMFSDKVHEKAR